MQTQEDTPRQERGDDGEGGVLRRRRNERDHTILDRRKQRILLCLREAVDLVDEHHRRLAFVEGSTCGFELCADLLDTSRDRRDLDESCPGLTRDDRRQRSLPNARRAPQEDAHGLPFDEASQRRAWLQQMLLAHDLVEIPWTHPHRQRCALFQCVPQRSDGLVGIEVAEEVVAHDRPA